MKNILKNLGANWKTTSAGAGMIATGIIHLVFKMRAGSATEGDWIGAVSSVMGGVGLLFAGDASATGATSAAQGPGATVASGTTTTGTTGNKI